MNRFLVFVVSLTASTVPCLAATSGTVTDRLGNGLANVNVSLVQAGSSTTTDAKGAWSLGTSGLRKRSPANSSMRWTGKAVELTLAEPSTVSVEEYDLKGALQRRLSGIHLGAGRQNLALSKSVTRFSWLRVTVNGRITSLLAGWGGTSPAGGPNQLFARQSGLSDTLLFTWKSREVARLPLANSDTSGFVLMIGADSSVAWNQPVAYGNLYDPRDGQAYRTVRIGNQVWMAENLNFKPSRSDSGWCRYNFPSYCQKYGRLYPWSGTMANEGASRKTPSGVQGICPRGWHVPSDTEWTILTAALEADPRVGTGKAGTAMKSTGDWSVNSFDGTPGNGTDLFGFKGLSAGFTQIGNFYSGNSTAYFWSTSEIDSTGATMRSLNNSETRLHNGGFPKAAGVSLRCVEGAGDPPQKQHDATLDSLWISSGTLSPVFSRNTQHYVDTVDNLVRSVMLSARASEHSSAVSYATQASGRYTASQPVNTRAGRVTTISVNVAAIDGTTRTYAVDVFRKSDPSFPDDSAALMSLAVSNGALSPAFSKGTNEYTDTVESTEHDLTVTGIASEASSQVVYRYFTGTDTANTWTTNGTFYLAEGLVTTISVIVTSADGANRIYKVRAYRKIWSPAITDSGTFTDTRDNHVYKMVTIGTQTWMAQNLNFKPAGTDSGWCHVDLVANCSTYGRLYQWNSAMAGAASSMVMPSAVQGVCPSGWHLPSYREWHKLGDTTLNGSMTGRILKSTTGWSSNNGLDLVRFHGLPGGTRQSDGAFLGLGSTSGFWSASENDATDGFGYLLGADSVRLERVVISKTTGFSVRCIRNSP